MKIISPTTSEEWNMYYRLRYDVLREPWNQPHGSEILNDEDQAIHAMMMLKEEAVAVARLHVVDTNIGQVRCVAVATNQQGKGIGSTIMLHLEKEAKEKGLKEIMLEARENAVPFYKNLGYEITKESYLLFGEIQHYTMRKEL